MTSVPPGQESAGMQEGVAASSDWSEPVGEAGSLPGSETPAAAPFGTDPVAPPTFGAGGYPQGEPQAQPFPQPGYAEQPYPVAAPDAWANNTPMYSGGAGYNLATPGARLGQALFDVVLAVVTLGIGYLIWSIVATWPQGQTPAMKIMHLRCVRKANGQPATLGTMAMRQIVGGILQGVLNYIIIGLVLYFMIFWDKDRQLIWDKVAGTVVVAEAA